MMRSHTVRLTVFFVIYLQNMSCKIEESDPLCGTDASSSCETEHKYDINNLIMQFEIEEGTIQAIIAKEHDYSNLLLSQILNMDLKHEFELE